MQKSTELVSLEAPMTKEFGAPGGASRFLYSAKASKKERRKSKHPTVKPLALTHYLRRLITPKGGGVLDPFAGWRHWRSGGGGRLPSGHDRTEPEYVEDIDNRMNAVTEEDPQLEMPATTQNVGSLNSLFVE